jgi:transcriptional regulator with XRE-family HTH domain
MQGFARGNLRQELDEALLPFRLVLERKSRGQGWLKSIRQAVGMPVDEMARRLGVCRWEIHRLEASEKNSRIMLATLSRAAQALDCELVYALAPKKGTTLEKLAAEQEEVRERLRQEREMEQAALRKPWLEEIGWREKMLGALRTELRKEGFRVRPRKTERGVAKQMAEFKETMKLASYAKVLGPAMSELANQQGSESASRQADRGRRVNKE